MKRRHIAYDGGTITSEVLDFATAMIACERTDGKTGENDPPHGWIVRNLLKYGALGYIPDDSPLAGWYIANYAGLRDRYAQPTQLFLRTQATDTTVFPYSSAAYIRANPSARPPILTIERYARTIAQCDIAIAANVVASTRTQIIGVPAKQKNDVELLIEDAATGMPTILTPEALESIQMPLDISVPFDARDKHALRQALYAELLKHFGGVTPTEYKAERVQSAEVSAHVAEAVDNVYVMIDTANADMKRQGVPFRLCYVGVGSALDPTADQESADNADDTEEVGVNAGEG